ncbi:uncharacterized protein DEA37_0004540 [Paragonimus westermani]|uniref:C2H2-type domain-containing protein n=1 Tax=Paragonimus westermani TaxID=34504 RepID=A0A5J4N9D9_9TREM|nr:uncharacterized protein DEA37_0004540 [Paragonimus westermani]
MDVDPEAVDKTLIPQDHPGCAPIALTKRVYGKPKIWICRFCQWQVDTYSQLRRHMVYHKGSRHWSMMWTSGTHCDFVDSSDRGSNRPQRGP